MNSHQTTELPTLYQSFVHKSRYARWLEEEGRRETWNETVDRYIGYMCDKQCEGKIPEEVRGELKAGIHDLEVMPSMRCMMTAGQALERDNVAGFNCFAGDTLVTTKEYGIIAIEELAGKEVHVVDGNGQWTLAKCRSYGKGKTMLEVSLATSGRGADFSITATNDHDWVMRDGTRKKTYELESGDRLAFVSMPDRDAVNDDSDDYRAGVVHGIIYGDGSAQYRKKKVCKGFAIRLCSDANDLLPYFDKYPVSYPPSFKGDPVVYLFGDEAIDLKALPDTDTGFFTHDYLVGFMRGWMAADGSVSKGGQTSLATNAEGLAWAYKHGPTLGFVIRNHRRFPEETNLGKRKSHLYYAEFDRRWMNKDDILIERKRKRFSEIDSKKNPGFGKVTEVCKTAHEQEVYCFDVPTTHSFLLTKNILTGNCSYLAIDNIVSFDEMLYILMCGTGVGFSVERQFVNKLPRIAERLRPSQSKIVVHDSKIGWANAYRELIAMLYQGRIPKWDVSEVRPAGERLKTFGGRASGPEPLEDLFRFTIDIFKNASGRKLNSVECHDLCCKIGEIVVVGGVRRSALISLSNPSDDRMRHAKSGQWWEGEPQRALANNSACYTEKPDMDTFMREWLALMESKSGERGIFNRESAQKLAAKYGRRETDHEFGTNPCSEIILRSMEFCNLSEVVVRAEDNLESLKRKVRLATIIGTMQATLTKFRYLREVWAENTKEECLLGVSLTGILDNSLMSGKEGKKALVAVLNALREYAVEVNKEWSEKLGVNQSVAITCVKPSGCRPGDALTATSAGLLTLDELLHQHSSKDEWSSVADISAYQDDRQNNITKTYRNGVSDTVKIKMSYNLEVESTPNHQWYVVQRYDRSRLKKYIDVNRWVRADELQPNDILDVNTRAYRKESAASLVGVPSGLDVRCFDISVPKEMDDELAWLLGYLWGDGTMSPQKYRIRFVDEHIPHLERAKRILEDKFGFDDISIRPASEDRNASVLEVGSRQLWEWFLANGIWKYGENGIADIPRAIRSSSWKHIISFFAGLLDADGCSHSVNGYWSACISTADARFAKHLQDIAWSVGLCFGRSRNTEGDNLQAQKSMWTLSLSTVTDSDAGNYLVGASTKMTKIRNSSVFTRWIFTDAKYGLIPGKVVEIGVGRTCETYDVEVEKEHWYYAGCVKSHNTVSQLVDASSGIHPRFSPYYIRTVRADKKDPLCIMMTELGFPVEDENLKPDHTSVFSFPVKSPDCAIISEDFNAIEHLELWKTYQVHWCEHKPSVTIYVRDHEWMEVGAWVYKNWDLVSGISFLPHCGHTYAQAPYQECTEEEFNELEAKMPKEIDWADLVNYEKTDHTKGSQTLACTGGMCQIVDLT